MVKNTSKKKESVSIIVPAFNEARSLAEVVQGIIKTVRGVIEEFEIIIVDDGSTDETGAIAEALVKKDKRIRVIHHTKNDGFGKTFRDGIAVARYTYLTGLPGDNDTAPQTIIDLYSQRHKADLISSYPANIEARTLGRQILSRLYVISMNLLFGLKMRYYTGYFLCKTKELQALPLISNGFTIFAEIKVRLLRQRKTMAEVPFTHIRRHHGRSKAVTIKGASQVFADTVRFLSDFWGFSHST